MEYTKVKRIITNEKKKLYFKEYESNLDYVNDIEFNKINIYPELLKQKFIGFGGAVTESVAYSYSLLNEDNKNNLIKDYFSKDGLNYNFIRTHINSSDFSLSSYSYSNERDLSDFSIDHDKNMLIPMIKNIINENKNINILSTPWSPPEFMKSNNSMLNGGYLKEEYYSLYAEYLVKYINSYKDEGININYLNIQNELGASQIWESCLFTYENEYKFINKYLYPLLKKNNIDINLLCFDHNKDNIYDYAKNIFKLDKNNIIKGIGYHYYTGDHFNNINILSNLYKDKLLIHTEGCCGLSKFRKRRSIPNALIYAHDIIGDVNNGCNAYIDWNILLNYKGGPNHTGNYCYSPVMLTKNNKSYKKNLAYYYIGHISKYINNATVIEHSKYTSDLSVLSFINKDKTITTIILNESKKTLPYNIVINNKCVSGIINPYQIETLIIS